MKVGSYVSEVSQKFSCSFVQPKIWITFSRQFEHRVECSVVSRQNCKAEVEMI